MDEKLLEVREMMESALDNELMKEFPDPKALELFERVQLITIEK